MPKKTAHIAIVVLTVLLAGSMLFNAVIGTQFPVAPFMPYCELRRGEVPDDIELPFHPTFNQAAVDALQYCLGGSFAQMGKDGELHVVPIHSKDLEARHRITNFILNVFLYAPDRGPSYSSHKCSSMPPAVAGRTDGDHYCAAIDAVVRRGQHLDAQ